MLLAAADRRLGICAKLAAKIADRRIPTALSTSCRTSCAPASWRSPAALRMPTISTAAPRSGVQAGLRSASLQRPRSVLATDGVALENAPSLRELIRLMGVLVDPTVRAMPCRPQP